MKRKCFPFTPYGKVTLPPSKSYTHRALIAAALACGTSRIFPYTPSNDISATQKAVTALGARCLLRDDSLYITGGNSSETPIDVFCGESASTLRFMIPVSAALGITASYDGIGRLPSRPILPYVETLKEKGVDFSQNSLPFSVSGKLKPGNYSVVGNISSQFITGLLFALPLLDKDSRITINGEVKSAPYIDMTVDLLKKFGIFVCKTENGFIVPGKQLYKPCDCHIEGDASQASCLAVLGCRGKNPITLSGLFPNSLQGDYKFFSLLKNCGADILQNKTELTVYPAKKLRPFVFDISQSPDLAPAVALLGCLCEGRSKIIGCHRLEFKESNRFLSVIKALTAIGGKPKKDGDCMLIYGTGGFSGGIADSFNDHRIAMMLAAAAAFSPAPIIISNAEAVCKSYPEFYRDYHKLGGISNVVDL